MEEVTKGLHIPGGFLSVIPNTAVPVQLSGYPLVNARRIYQKELTHKSVSYPLSQMSLVIGSHSTHWIFI